MSNLSKTESRKAVRISKPLFAQIQDPVPSLHSPDCLTVLILRVQIDQMMVVAPGVAYGTCGWRELYIFRGKPSEKYFLPLGDNPLK